MFLILLFKLLTHFVSFLSISILSLIPSQSSLISEATRCINYYISRRNCLFIFIDSFIICAINSISSITSIQVFSEEGIIHRLGEGFDQHKILRPQVIFKTRSSTGVNVLGGIYVLYIYVCTKKL